MSPMQSPVPHMFAAPVYAAERLLVEAIHDEHVSVDAVVVLDALAEHSLPLSALRASLFGTAA